MLAYFRTPVSWRELARRTLRETWDDGCPGLAAQLAFYFFLALFPALLFLISLLAYLPIESTLAGALQRMESIVPGEALTLLQAQLDSVLAGRRSGLMTLAVAGAIWSSSSAMTAIISALNTAYDIEEWRPWWKARLVAMALTLALALFIGIAFALVVGGADVAEWMAARIGGGELFVRAWTAAPWLVAIALAVFAVNLVYHFAPNADAEWVWLTPGALLAVTLWFLTSLGLRFYLQSVPGYLAVYGTIGGAIVLMLWLYLSGFALLIGAELNAEIDRALPSHDNRPQGPGRKKKIGPAAEKAHVAQNPRVSLHEGERGSPPADS